MCDYSAKSAKTRAAVRGDMILTNDISKHTRGFASVIEPATAVCLLPGTQLAFDGPIQFWQPDVAGKVAQKVSCLHRVATFVQVDKHDQHTHHDALQFADDSVIKLNDLVPGQTARVLQLPALPTTPQEVERQRRAEYV
jgi:hypothetical protein